MKKIILSITLLLSVSAFAQPKENTATDLNFVTLLNAPQQNIKLSALKGKVVVLEFWATWCGACLGAMPHLMQLQKDFQKKIQIVTVSSESQKRIAAYLRSKPSNLWFAVDTAGIIAKTFPHQLIPHTILISPTGEVLGSTNPEAITALVIDSVLAGKKVHLPNKQDVAFESPEQLMEKVFPADRQKKSWFVMQQEIKGAPGFSTTYPLDSLYKGKRITAINLSMSDLYRLAYGSFPYKRTTDETAAADRNAAYCLDIMVENKDELLPALQKELLKRFDVQARIVPQQKEVNVLKVVDAKKFESIQLNSDGKRTFYSRHGEIDQKGMNMSDFAQYLESYGTSKLFVIDETGSNLKYDIKFSFQPEDPATLTTILDGMGLKLEKQQRNVEMLTIFKAQ